MEVTNYKTDAAYAGDIAAVHEHVQEGELPQVYWNQCPNGTRVVRARFLADKVQGCLIVDHSYTIVQFPDGSLHYLEDVVWSPCGGGFRNWRHFKAWVYKQVKASGVFYPGLFDAINVFC